MMMRRFLIALQFLTRFPLKIEPAPSIEEIGRSMTCFPAAGLCLGVYLVALNSVLSCFLPPLVVDILLILGLVLASGAMHMDGLADMVDGFYAGNALPSGDARKRRILEVMKDSHVGVMGALAVFFVLALKIFCIHSLPPDAKNSLLLLTPCLSRWYMVWAAATSNYARKTASNPSRNCVGLGETFTHFITPDELKTASALPCLSALFILKFNGVILLILTLISLYMLIKYIRRGIDGMTGDTLGALNEIMETLVLVFALALTG